MPTKIGTFFQRLFTGIKQLPGINTFAQFLGLPNYEGWIAGYTKYAQEGYSKAATVFVCVNKIAAAASGVELLTYDVSNPLEPQEVANEVSTLFRKPNPDQSWRRFASELLSYLLIGGNAYILIVRRGEENMSLELGNKKRNLIGLWNINPGFLTLRKDGQYDYSNGEETKVYPAERILHLHTFNPEDPTVGLSPIQVASLAIDENLMGKKWNIKLMLSGGTPTGAFVSKMALDTERREKIQQRYQDSYAGWLNAGKPLVLEGGLEWQSLGIPPKDIEWMNSRKLSTHEICNVYGVPPELVGYPEHRTYNNYAEAREAFYTETALPWLDFLLEEINERLIKPTYGEYELVYNPDKIKALQENVDELWKRAIEGKREGLLSLNEARQIVGYNTVRFGNIISQPMGLVPVATDDDKDPETIDSLLYKPEEGGDEEAYAGEDEPETNEGEGDEEDDANDK